MDDQADVFDKESLGFHRVFSSAGIEFLRACVCGCCLNPDHPPLLSSLRSMKQRELRRSGGYPVSAPSDKRVGSATATVSPVFAGLCQATQDRQLPQRTKARPRQVLVLLAPGNGNELVYRFEREIDALKADPVPQETDARFEALAKLQRVVDLHGIFLTFLEICDRDALTHLDFLFALTSGFDQIWLQNPFETRDRISREKQFKQIALAGSLGGTGRLFMFRAVGDLVKQLGHSQEVTQEGVRSDPSSRSRPAAVREMVRVLQAKPTTEVPLPGGAPYGHLELKSQSCTLCRACVGRCPTGALSLTPNTAALTFTEADCLQCGLCVSACSDSALALIPGLSLEPQALSPQPLKEKAASFPASNTKKTRQSKRVEASMLRVERHRAEVQPPRSRARRPLWEGLMTWAQVQLRF